MKHDVVKRPKLSNTPVSVLGGVLTVYIYIYVYLYVYIYAYYQACVKIFVCFINNKLLIVCCQILCKLEAQIAYIA